MNLQRFLAGLALGVAALPASAQSVRDGIAAWQHANYAAAVAIWRPLAEKGNADAQFNLGQAYRLGRGVPINLAAAVTWFERAANKGHLDAQTTLGLLLFENGDRAGGVRWLKQAAEKSDPRALLVYGTALFNGDGVRQDPILGYAYVSRASALGFLPAQSTLEQLDQILPVEQRKKALTVAMSMAKGGRPPKSRVAPPAPPPVVAEAKPVKTPAPAPAHVAPPSSAVVPQTTGGWRIQLGAFNNRATAEAAYRKLAGNAALAGRSPQYLPFDRFIRLRVGPFASKESAAAACAAVKVPCFPVPGK